MTDVEQKLWRELRNRRFAAYKFCRQVPMQRYIADFLCYDPKLIIELDGGQHADQQTYDQKREAFFRVQGFQILRFWNHEMLRNSEAVLQVILDALRASPHPNLKPGALSHKERGYYRSNYDANN